RGWRPGSGRAGVGSFLIQPGSGSARTDGKRRCAPPPTRVFHLSGRAEMENAGPASPGPTFSIRGRMPEDETSPGRPSAPLGRRAEALRAEHAEQSQLLLVLAAWGGGEHEQRLPAVLGEQHLTVDLYRADLGVQQGLVVGEALRDLLLLPQLAELLALP